MTLSIYSPEVIATARREGITDLQAYRNAQAREAFALRREVEGAGIISRIVGTLADRHDKIAHPLK